jgi:hypothetical protein
MGKLRRVNRLLNSGMKIKDFSNDELVKLAESLPFERLLSAIEVEMTTRLVTGNEELKAQAVKKQEAKEKTFTYALLSGFKQSEASDT